MTGYHHALIAGALIAAAGSVVSAWLIGVVHRDRAVDPAVSLLEPA